MQQTPFPPSIGLENYLPQFAAPQSGWQQSGWQQFPSQTYAVQPFGGQSYGGQSYGPQLHGSQQQMVSQLLPIAYQVILPQVVATATQQIQQYVQYLASQQPGPRPWGI
jgi:hypothetical protein